MIALIDGELRLERFLLLDLFQLSAEFFAVSADDVQQVVRSGRHNPLGVHSDVVGKFLPVVVELRVVALNLDDTFRFLEGKKETEWAPSKPERRTI